MKKDKRIKTPYCDAEGNDIWINPPIGGVRKRGEEPYDLIFTCKFRRYGSCLGNNEERI